MKNPCKAWSPAEAAEAWRMYESGMTMPEIAMAIGRSLGSVRGKIRQDRPPAVPMRATSVVRCGTPTPEMFEERNRRFSFPQTITAVIFGDPRPGQSALDKRRGA